MKCEFNKTKNHFKMDEFDGYLFLREIATSGVERLMKISRQKYFYYWVNESTQEGYEMNRLLQRLNEQPNEQARFSHFSLIKDYLRSNQEWQRRLGIALGIKRGREDDDFSNLETKRIR